MNKLTLLSSVAVAAMLALPLATADAQSRGSGARASVSAGSRGSSSGHFAGRSGFNNRTGAGRWNGNGRWGNNNNWRFHHRYGGFYGGFYPYWYPWDYGYGYGYGYGSGYGYGNGYSYYGDNGYRGRRGNLTVNIQQELSREGFYRGPIDGVIGGRTRTAIRAYERANGLHVDGLIDQRLLETMGLS